MSSRQDRAAARQILKALTLRNAEVAHTTAMEIENVELRQQLADSEERNAQLSALIPVPAMPNLELPPPLAPAPIVVPFIDLSLSDGDHENMPILLSSAEEVDSDASTVADLTYADVTRISIQELTYCDYISHNGIHCYNYAGYFVKCNDCVPGVPAHGFEGLGCNLFCISHILKPDVVCRTCNRHMEFAPFARRMVSAQLRL